MSNIDELSKIYRRITVLELFEKLKGCALKWNKVNDSTYRITYWYDSYKIDNKYWDITLGSHSSGKVLGTSAFESQTNTIFMEFHINGTYFDTIFSYEDSNLISFYNEIHGNEEYLKEKEILTELSQYERCRVPNQPLNIIASQGFYYDETTMSNLDILPGYCFVSLDWNQPANYGSSPVTNYIVEHSLDGFNWINSFLAGPYNPTTEKFDSAGLISTSRKVLYLLTATPYIFRIAARNSVGLGEWNWSNSVCTIAAKPNNLVCTQTGPKQLKLNWSEQNSGPCFIIGHQFRAIINNQSFITINPANNTVADGFAIFDNLTSGYSYRFAVSTRVSTNFGPFSEYSSIIFVV